MAYCNEYTELISAAVDGALSPAQQEMLETHLASCPDCAALFRELSALHAALEDLPCMEPPAELKSRILEEVAQEKLLPFSPPEKKGLSRHSQRWLATAAALALVVFGAWSWKPWERNDITGQPAPAAATPLRDSASAETGGPTPEADQAAVSQNSAPAEELGSATPEIASRMAPQEDISSSNDGVTAPSPEAKEMTAPEAVPAPANAAPTLAPKLGRSMAVDGGSALEESASEPQTAEILPEEEEQIPPVSPETQNVTALQAPALFSAPVPSSVPEEKVGEAPEPLMVGAGVPEGPVESPELIPRDALDRLLEEFPMPEGAQLIASDTFLGWQTPSVPVEGEEQQVSTYMEYLGLTTNGKYHEFWLHSLLVDDPQEGLAHSSTLNFFAVPLEEGEILVQRREPEADLTDEAALEAYEAGIQAYLEATTK